MTSRYSFTPEPIRFPDGAVSLQYEQQQQYPIIRIRDSEGVVAALQLARQTDVINIPYFPFARQDHPPHSDLATFIAALDAQRQTPLTVVTFDPHSEAVELLFEQSRNLELVVRGQDFFGFTTNFVQSLETNTKPVLVLPDAGAAKKYLHLYERSFDQFFSGYITCTKLRDPETGNFSHTHINDPDGLLNIKNAKFVIIDDLCDGEATFVNIAKATKLPPEQLALWVSHGVFSKGTDTLFEHFSSIGTTNSYWHHDEITDDRLTVYALFKIEE